MRSRIRVDPVIRATLTTTYILFIDSILFNPALETFSHAEVQKPVRKVIDPKIRAPALTVELLASSKAKKI